MYYPFLVFLERQQNCSCNRYPHTDIPVQGSYQYLEKIDAEKELVNHEVRV